jgi:hypothetical protein
MNGGADEQTARLSGLKSRQTTDRVLWVQLPPAPHLNPHERTSFRMDSKQIVLQFFEQQQRVNCELCRSTLLLIEYLLSGEGDPAALAAAAARVRAALYSADALADTVGPIGA